MQFAITSATIEGQEQTKLHFLKHFSNTQVERKGSKDPEEQNCAQITLLDYKMSDCHNIHYGVFYADVRLHLPSSDKHQEILIL